MFGLWLSRGIFQISQISKELKQYHHVESLDDVRVIRDRQTSTTIPSVTWLRRHTDVISEASRGFGFIRFPTLGDSKAFVERNYPMIYLYGNGSSDNDDQAAKVRIAYSRERDDRSRGEKAEGEWTCKIVRNTQTGRICGITKAFSAHLSTSQAVRNATGVRHRRSVRVRTPNQAMS